MSIKIMVHVWEHSKQRSTNLLMLLAIADMANDDGDCWPSVGHLAKKTRMSDRNTQKILRKLEVDKEIAIFEGEGKQTSNGWTNRYRITTGVSQSSPKSPLQSSDKRQSAQALGGWYDAIKSVWGYEAGRNGDTSNWLSGKKLKAQYKDYPIEPPLTPDELVTWSKDWRKSHPDIDMVESPAKVQDSIIKWRHEQHERFNPKMSRTRELMEAQHKFQREQFGIGAPYDEPIKL